MHKDTDNLARVDEQPLSGSSELPQRQTENVSTTAPENSAVSHGTLGVPLHLRRDPTAKDFADPRFDVLWELMKRVDVDFRNGLFSGATGNDVVAVLDALDHSRAHDIQALIELLREYRETSVREMKSAQSRGNRTALMVAHGRECEARTLSVCIAELEKLAALPVSPSAQEWREIESAPKDGTHIWLTWSGLECVGRWNGMTRQWDTTIGIGFPNRWKPIAAPVREE